jgi:hypothetical protein
LSSVTALLCDGCEKLARGYDEADGWLVWFYERVVDRRDEPPPKVDKRRRTQPAPRGIEYGTRRTRHFCTLECMVAFGEKMKAKREAKAAESSSAAA